MTLKEKFDSISCKDCDMPYCDIRCTILSEKELNKLEQIADEYAIEFAEWLTETRLYNEEVYSMNNTKELLKIFKKGKGL